MTAIELEFPISCTSLATLSASSLLRAFTTMPEYVLDFAKASAIALPMPLLEPVITATFPVRLVSLRTPTSVILYSSAPAISDSGY